MTKGKQNQEAQNEGKKEKRTGK